MFKFLKKLSTKAKRRSGTCRVCLYKVKSRHTWYCKHKVKVIQGYAHYAHICGHTKPKTSPGWCPIRKGEK